MWADEMERGVEKYGPKDRPATDLERTRTAYALRFEKVNKARIDLDLETLWGEILWGKDIRKMTDRLHSFAVELGVALMQYLAEKKERRVLILDPEQLDREIKNDMRIHKIIFFGGGPDDDTLTFKITQSLDDIDAFCRPMLRSRQVKARPKTGA